MLSDAGITLEDMIGKGSFSHVYKATRPDGPVAVKVMLYESTKPVPLDEVEVAVLRSGLRHQHIVQLIDVFCGATTCIVLEFCAGGDLYTVLHKPQVPLQLSVNQHLSIVHGIGQAIQFLHSQNIIHRDVKSSNCLLAETLKNTGESPLVKLADFGFAKVMTSHMTSQFEMSKGIGSSRWMAPEVYAGDKYDSSADVYSFGVFMYEVFSHELPYGKQALDPRFGLQICYGKRPQMSKLPDWCTQELRDLIESCWTAMPSERPTMVTVAEVIGQAMQQ
jgi:serine/threonine protein kinase